MNHLFEETYTVSSFLDEVNSSIKPLQATIIGEISSFSFRRHCYFTLKDKSNEAVLSCFMWENVFKMMSIQMEQGLEVIVRGYPEVYKPTGRLTFQTKSIELVGEGVLQKAYEELKNKLEEEGLFLEDRKKPIPLFPQKIGVITSQNGAVIKDLLNNLGNYGFQISLYDSRVEGISAVDDIHKGIEHFRNKSIDILVIIRGGGSLESLQAFNNEYLIRSVIEYPIPIICGIGHDKDVPLISLVADLAVSTPTAVAKSLNTSWEKANDQVVICQKNLLHHMSMALVQNKQSIDHYENRILLCLRRIKDRFTESISLLIFNVSLLRRSISESKKKVDTIQNYFSTLMQTQMQSVKNALDYYLSLLNVNNPKTVLKRGYGIVRLNNKIIQTIQDLNPEDAISIQLLDGIVQSTVNSKQEKEIE